MPFSIEDHLYNSFKSFYNNSPQFTKSLLGRLYGATPNVLRYGKKFVQDLTLLERSQWWTKEKIEEYQWEKTKKLLQHAYDNVVYYKNLLDENGITLKSIQNFQDFKKIPFLTREIVQNNLNNLLAKNYKRSNLIPVTSGGSTGTPLKFYYEKGVSRTMENAFILSLWNRYGYKEGDKVAVLRGEAIKNKNNDVPSYFDPIKNRLIISSYYMKKENLSDYIRIIKEFNPKFLHVYPSSLYILANFINDQKMKGLPKIYGIFASSESIHDWQIDLFKEVFKCKVYHWYGLTELVALAGVCEISNYYHIMPEYSYVEMVEPDYEVDAYEGEKISEIVGTSYANNAMPFIRYRTTDYGTVENRNCSCGRNHLLIKKIIGRKQEFFIDKTGNLITFTGYNRPIRPLTEKIFAYQYVQEVPGAVVLNIEQKRIFNEGDIKIIRDKFEEIWPFLDLSINFVESIPRTRSGKFLYLTQKVKNTEYQ